MPSVSRFTAPYLMSAAGVLLALTGCSSNRLIPSIGDQTVALHMQGKVHGGQQPVNGARIQLFDITSAQLNGTGAAGLIGVSVTSDATGGFNITGDYTCPAASDQVYLVASGGDAGSGINADLVMMTALGDCGNLTASTFISVNEVTTVATIFAYAAFFDVTQTGGGNLTVADANAYQNFLTLADPTSGAALATNGADAQLQLNALANTLSVCVNSATDSNGASSACDTLIAMAESQPNGAVSADSGQAAFAIASHPSYNVAAVYGYAPPSPPFQPTLSSAPSSWNLNMPY